MQRRSVLKKLKFRVSETAKAIQEENQKEYFIELQSLRYCFCKECEQNNQTEVEQNKTKKKNQKHLAIDEKVNHCYSKGKIQRKQTKITLQFLDFIAKKKKKAPGQMIFQTFHFRTIQNHKSVNPIPLLPFQNPKIYSSPFPNTTQHSTVHTQTTSNQNHLLLRSAAYCDKGTTSDNGVESGVGNGEFRQTGHDPLSLSQASRQSK